MFRCVCAPLLFLLLSGTVHADLLLSTTEESYVFPTSTPSPEEMYTPVPVVTTAAPGAPSGLTNITTVAPTANHTNVTTPTTNVTTVIPTSNTTVIPTSNTTVIPTSNTTVIPTSNTTVSTPAPTTTPLPEPFIGNYNVSDAPGLICLKARMGLQFSFRSPQGANFESVNIDPNAMTISGTCGSNSTNSTLVLTSEKVTVQFIFAITANKFHLSGLEFFVNISGNPLSDQNHSLSLWEASLGNSYMCRKEQSFNVTSNLTLNTFELQVQPYRVSNNKFSTAEDCQAQSFIVPIAVGVALGVLIIIVMLAYFIGRKRSQASSYEQLN